MRLVVIATVAVIGVTGCVSSQSPEDRSRACHALADDVSGIDLDGTPTLDQAKSVATKLDSRLSELRDPSTHDPAVELHASVHVIQNALEDGDAAKAADATRRARTAATEAATACHLPPADFGL
jgi:hypothetical protein